MSFMARKQRIPAHERSKQLEYYYKVRRGDPSPSYNNGAPRANLGGATPLQQRVITSLYGKKSLCKRDGILYDLDSDWVKAQPDTCAVTGIPLSFGDPAKPDAVNVDRIDPQKGYLKSNCRLVAHWYNQAKSNWPDADVQKYIISAAKFLTK